MRSSEWREQSRFIQGVCSREDRLVILIDLDRLLGDDDPAFTRPVIEYSHGNGDRQGNSVTGGVVYRGPIDIVRDSYIFADFISENIWSVPVADILDGETVQGDGFTIQTAAFAPDEDEILDPVHFTLDAAGRLYIVDLGGFVFRLETQ